MGLVCDGAVRAVLCTASEPLAERLRGMLLRWAVGECVSLTAEQTDRIPAPESGSAQLLFLDLDSVELPEQGRLEKKSPSREEHGSSPTAVAAKKKAKDAGKKKETTVRASGSHSSGLMCQGPMTSGFLYSVKSGSSAAPKWSPRRAKSSPRPCKATD